MGSSLQDMRSPVPHTTPETKSSSACSLHVKAQGSSDSGKLHVVQYITCCAVGDTGSSEYESASQHSSSSTEEKTAAQKTTTYESAVSENTGEDKAVGCSSSLDQRAEGRSERSNSVAGSELHIPQRTAADGYSLSYPRSHRREPSDSAATGSPSRVHHRRIHSLSISVNSSRSTSAYSTLSERSAPVVAAEDTESVLSSRTRVTTQTQVEQSRVDTSSVIDELLQQQASTLSASVEEEPPGLQIYVDRSKGGVIVAGADMERY